MAEETKTIPLDTVDMPTYKAAREAGNVETVSVEDAEDARPPEITGKEEMKEFKEKRDHQKSGGGWQKRIDRLTKEKSVLEEGQKQLREELARYKASEHSNGAGPQKEQPWDETEIRKKEFDRFHHSVKEMREQRADWKEIESAAEQIRVTQDMQAQIISFENGHDVVIYLAKHPEVSRDLHKMSAFEAMRKLDRISLKLELDAERKEQRSQSASKAFAPIHPVTGGATRSTVPLDEMDMKAFKKAREAGRVR
jgi:hypothetical protein